MNVSGYCALDTPTTATAPMTLRGLQLTCDHVEEESKDGCKHLLFCSRHGRHNLAKKKREKSINKLSRRNILFFMKKVCSKHKSATNWQHNGLVRNDKSAKLIMSTIDHASETYTLVLSLCRLQNRQLNCDYTTGKVFQNEKKTGTSVQIFVFQREICILNFIKI